MYLTETSQGQVFKKLGMEVGVSIWHYMQGESGAKIFKTQPSKKLMDELWFRCGADDDSEYLTSGGLKKLKKDFYSLAKEFKGWYFTEILPGKEGWMKK